jgi:tetratricopeptide (TPR) repeat protein
MLPVLKSARVESRALVLGYAFVSKPRPLISESVLRGLRIAAGSYQLALQEFQRGGFSMANRLSTPSYQVIVAQRLMLGMLSLSFLFSAAPAQTPTAAKESEVESHLLKGEEGVKANRLDQALVEFDEVLKLDSGNAEANVGVGLLNLMRGDCEHAELSFRVALKRAPASADAKGLLGVCEKRRGESSALSLLQAGFGGIKDPKRRMVVGVELADYYYGRNDNEHAVPILQSLIAMNPDNTDLLFFAQHVYQDMADDTLNRLALIAPDSARMQQAIAEHLVNNGDLQNAIEHYRKALAIDPYLPGADFEMGEAILQVGHDANSLAAARQEFQKAIQIDGQGPRVECSLARILSIEGKNDEALAGYRRAYAMNPAYGEAQMGIARILIDGDKPGEAIPYLQKLLDNDPLNADARYQFARALKAVNKPEDAKEQLRLFQEIRSSKDKVIELYRQMNKRPTGDSTGVSDTNQ